MTRLDALVCDLRHLLVVVGGNLREPVPQCKPRHRITERDGALYYGGVVQAPGHVERASLSAGNLAALERLRDALATCRGISLQVPVLPAKTEEQTELEILRAQVRPSVAPIESAAENPSVGSRV